MNNKASYVITFGTRHEFLEACIYFMKSGVMFKEDHEFMIINLTGGY